VFGREKEPSAITPIKLRRIDHTAIVVADMDAALQRYHQLFGVHPTERVVVPDQQVEVAFLSLGDTQLELVHPTTSTSGIARFLQRRGEGLHHVGVLVADIREELRTLQSAGVELIDPSPRQGAHGLIAFIHPRATGGVLIELIEKSL
jgi:methylmalonyl-CoA/ethylmalonyl-CoA epimerase